MPVPRIVEAYVGEYASGKSECAINRALELLNEKEMVTLADLDFVEPFYTLRPIREELKAKGLNVIAWTTGETLGFGETGSVVRPDMRWVLSNPGHVIMDVGYGVKGSKALNLVEGSWQDPDLQILVVVNTARPMTASVEDIVDYVKALGPVHGLINNSHLGDETVVGFVQEGARVVSRAASMLGLPLVATCADEGLKEDLGEVDVTGTQVRYLKRHMQRTFW